MHRVQRVPVTESQGRVHTSAAGVLVLPEAEQVDVDDRRERPAHRRLPLQRPGRPERQHHRLRGPDHPPADRHRGELPEREEPAAEQGAGAAHPAGPAAGRGPGGGRRRGQRGPPVSQVRTVDRSERIRTYNFPENRISDHRTGYKSYNLDQVLDGDLQPVLDSCVEADLAGPARPPSRPERADRSVAARRGGRPAAAMPASPVPSTTPPSCSRTCSAPTRSRLPLVDEVPDGRRDGYDALVARRAAREPLQHLTGTAYFRHVELAVGPGVFVPRPETELLAGWAIEPRACELAGAPVRRRPLHRLRRHRPGRRRRGPARPVHAVELDRRGARLGRAQPRRHRRRAAAGRPGHGVPRAATAASTSWSATRRTSRWRPGSRWPPRRATTTRTSRCSPATTGWTRSGRWSSARPRCCGPGGVVGAEHADVQGESAPAVFAAAGRWTDVRDHRDLAGRPRYLTARLARGPVARVQG